MVESGSVGGSSDPGVVPVDGGGWLVSDCSRLLQRLRHMCGHSLPLFM